MIRWRYYWYYDIRLLEKKKNYYYIIFTSALLNLELFSAISGLQLNNKTEILWSSSLLVI